MNGIWVLNGKVNLYFHKSERRLESNLNVAKISHKQSITPQDEKMWSLDGQVANS